jgi:hypothetical protein
MPPNVECTQISLPDCPVEATIYGYYPSLSANSFFTVFFFVAMIIQIVQGIRYKTWTFMLAMVLGCFAEGIGMPTLPLQNPNALTTQTGYVGRVILHYNPFSSTGFEMQICCLTMAPAFLAAGIYLLLKHLVLTFSPTYSRLTPHLYPWTFVSADILALVFQGAGGGIAATSSANHNQKMLDVGTDLMITGIVGQVITLLFVFAIVGDYSVRAYSGHKQGGHFDPETEKLRKSLKFRIFLSGVAISLLAIFARCVYRIAEMAGGWADPIMQDEPTFIALDGV